MGFKKRAVSSVEGDHRRWNIPTNIAIVSKMMQKYSLGSSLVRMPETGLQKLRAVIYLL